MDVISLVLAAVFGTGLCLFLMRIADDRLATETTNDKQTENNAELVVEESTYSPLKTAYSVLLFAVVCLGTIGFMFFFYRTPLLHEWNAAALLAVLWVSARSDLKAKLIFNSILLFGLAARIVILLSEALFSPADLPYDFLRSIVAAAALFLASVICRAAAKGALGFGDVKLLSLLGFYLSIERVWASVFFSMVCSFVLSVFILITKRGTVKSEIPFAPIVLAGTIISLILTSI